MKRVYLTLELSLDNYRRMQDCFKNVLGIIYTM